MSGRTDIALEPVKRDREWRTAKAALVPGLVTAIGAHLADGDQQRLSIILATAATGFFALSVQAAFRASMHAYRVVQDGSRTGIGGLSHWFLRSVSHRYDERWDRVLLMSGEDLERALLGLRWEDLRTTRHAAATLALVALVGSISFDPPWIWLALVAGLLVAVSVQCADEQRQTGVRILAIDGRHARCASTAFVTYVTIATLLLLPILVAAVLVAADVRHCAALLITIVTMLWILDRDVDLPREAEHRR